MKIVEATGQTCNKFWAYTAFFADSLETGEKIIILTPDITIRDYPNLLNSKIIIFPFFFRFISNSFFYHSYIKILNNILANNFSIRLQQFCFQLIKPISYIVAPTGKYRSKYWIKHKDEIKTLFTPDSKLTIEVDSFFKQLRSNHDLIIGIHIRRGDYKEFQEGKYYYTDKQYYSIIKNVKQLFPNKTIAFFISTNEKINLSEFTDCNCFMMPNGTSTKDMYGLSISDYIIGPPSSFSGWASFYGDVPLYFIEDPNLYIHLSSLKSIIEIWELNT